MTDRRATVDLYVRAVVFFTRYPDEQLTAEDVAVKFDVPKKSVWACLQHSVRMGLLGFAPVDPQRPRRMAYCAGPELLRMIGMGPVAGDLAIADALAACGACEVVHVEQSHGTLTVDL